MSTSPAAALQTAGAPPPLAREADRRRQLTTMRTWATSLLGAVAVLWLVLVVTGPTGTWAGYARAGLEAAMVGALADWFAVVALFRHPLGIPIPHTAVVVERKDQFGRTLAAFFRENFLSGAAVAERLRASRAVARAGAWAADEANATTLARQVLRYAGDLLDATSDDVAQFLVREARTVVSDLPLAGAGATALRGLSTSDLLDNALDRAADVAGRAMEEHRDELEERFSRDRPWWLPESVQRRVFDHVLARLHGALEDLQGDPEHPLRTGARAQLQELADRIEHDPEFAARLEAWKRSLVSDPRVNDAFAEFFGVAIARFRAQVREPGSSVEARLVDAIQGLGRRVRDDPTIHARVEDTIETVATRAIDVFGDDIDGLVTGTLARWDAERTADQMELLLGPDLQFIRINGTVVGGLAGLLIHGVGQVVG